MTDLGLSIEWSISLGNILSVVGFGASAIVLAGKVGRYVQKLDDFTRNQDKINDGRTAQIREMNGEFKELRTEIERLNVTVAQMASQKIMIEMHTKWIDELRHGIGIITVPRPLPSKT